MAADQSSAVATPGARLARLERSPLAAGVNPARSDHPSTVANVATHATQPRQRYPHHDKSKLRPDSTLQLSSLFRSALANLKLAALSSSFWPGPASLLVGIGSVISVLRLEKPVSRATPETPYLLCGDRLPSAHRCR